MLINRQLRFYEYSVNIWKQTTPPTDTGLSGAVPVLTDLGAIYSLSASAVSCMFWSTPENDEPTPIGRTKSVNIFTMDKWKFSIDVDIADTDLIHCTYGPNNFPEQGRVWLVQGNTQGHSTLAISNTQMVYAKLTTASQASMIGVIHKGTIITQGYFTR